MNVTCAPHFFLLLTIARLLIGFADAASVPGNGAHCPGLRCLPFLSGVPLRGACNFSRCDCWRRAHGASQAWQETYFPACFSLSVLLSPVCQQTGGSSAYVLALFRTLLSCTRKGWRSLWCVSSSSCCLLVHQCSSASPLHCPNLAPCATYRLRCSLDTDSAHRKKKTSRKLSSRSLICIHTYSS